MDSKALSRFCSAISTSTLNETLRGGLRDPPPLAMALALVARPLIGDGKEKTEGTVLREGDDAARLSIECEDENEGVGIGHRAASTAANGCVDIGGWRVRKGSVLGLMPPDALFKRVYHFNTLAVPPVAIVGRAGPGAGRVR